MTEFSKRIKGDIAWETLSLERPVSTEIIDIALSRLQGEFEESGIIEVPYLKIGDDAIVWAFSWSDGAVILTPGGIGNSGFDTFTLGQLYSKIDVHDAWLDGPVEFPLDQITEKHAEIIQRVRQFAKMLKEAIIAEQAIEAA